MQKEVDALLPDDFKMFPVWEFVLDSASDTLLRPVRILPIDDMTSRIVGINVRLATGLIVPAMLGNIDLKDAQKTRHFISLSLFNGSRWQHLARYHDPDFSTNGPEGIAAALHLPISDMFPITYDVRPCCAGNPLCTTGEIPAHPTEVLSRDEIIALSL